MYKILDEPQPSKWNHLAVNPIWPLFGAMFGGAWLSFTWYAFNGYALGCPNRLKTLFLAIGGFLGALVFTLLIFYLLTIEVVTKANIPYLLLLLLCWKLGVSYYLYIQQSRTFHIYEHFGNTVKNGIASSLLRDFVESNRLSSTTNLTTGSNLDLKYNLK